MEEFLNLITMNWLGFLIGIITASLLCLILGFTLFRNNRIAGVIVSVLLIIAFGFAGIFIQNTFFKGNGNVETNEDINNPGIIYLDPEKYTHITSDSGFDRTYVEENRPLAEICEDKFGDINMVEYKDVVIFSYDVFVNGVTYTPNIILTKAKNMLVFDGCFNIKLNLIIQGWGKSMSYYFTPTSTMLKSNPIQYTEFWRGDNFTNKNYETSKDDGYRFPFWINAILPRYFCITRPSTMHAGCGLDCWSSYPINGQRTYEKSASQFCYRLREALFQQIGDLTMLLSENQISTDMDTIYTDIYNCLKNNISYNYSIDVTNHFYYYQTVKKDNKNEYVLYNNKCILNVNYTNKADKNCFKTNTVDDDAKTRVDTSVPTVTKTVEEVDKITFKLINKYNRDLTGFDPQLTPVKIKLINKSDNTKTYTYLFDTMSKIKNGLNCGVRFGDYDVEISSDVLDLGTFDTLKVNGPSIVNINFDYQYGTILTFVRLNPLSNFDFSSVDLKSNPVTITFNNDTSSYNFVFDSVEKLNQILTKRVPIGQYKWSITSKELSFQRTYGTTEINVNNNQFQFNYDYKSNVEYRLALNNRGMSKIQEDYFSIYFTTLPFKANKIYIMITPKDSTTLSQYEFTYVGAKIPRKEMPFGTYYIQAKFILEDGSTILSTVFTETITEFISGQFSDGTTGKGYYINMTFALLYKN